MITSKNKVRGVYAFDDVCIDMDFGDVNNMNINMNRRINVDDSNKSTTFGVNKTITKEDVFKFIRELSNGDKEKLVVWIGKQLK